MVRTISDLFLEGAWAPAGPAGAVDETMAWVVDLSVTSDRARVLKERQKKYKSGGAIGQAVDTEGQAGMLVATRARKIVAASFTGTASRLVSHHCQRVVVGFARKANSRPRAATIGEVSACDSLMVGTRHFATIAEVAISRALSVRAGARCGRGDALPRLR